MNFVKEDFDYYRRTIEGMYIGYYNKRITITAVTLIIITGYSILLKENLLINILLAATLLYVLVFLNTQRKKFKEIYHDFLNINQSKNTIKQLIEDENSYDVENGPDSTIKINKNGVRNLPSSNKDLTMMVGFEKSFFTKQPLQIIYYNMLEIKYDEQYRLKRNGYSRMPAFLNRFSLSNMKASLGNFSKFTVRNIFLLLILFQVLRYVVDILKEVF
ncbi:hypothetical protein ACWY2R_07700 [Enterococcus avium]